MDEQRKLEGERLKQVREELGINQKVFAAKIGMEQGSLSDIERGRKKLSTSAHRKIAQFFGVNISWVLTGDGEKLLNDSEQLNVAMRNTLRPFQAMREHYVETIARITSKSVEQVREELQKKEDEMP